MPHVKVKDLEMFYEKMGNGDNVIFLHSGYSRGILAFASQILDFRYYLGHLETELTS